MASESQSIISKVACTTTVNKHQYLKNVTVKKLDNTQMPEKDHPT
jgi:hypothetical protein